MAPYNSMPIRATSSAPDAEDDAVGDLRDDAYANMGTLKMCKTPRGEISINTSRNFTDRTWNWLPRCE